MLTCSRNGRNHPVQLQKCHAWYGQWKRKKRFLALRWCPCNPPPMSVTWPHNKPYNFKRSSRDCLLFFSPNLAQTTLNEHEIRLKEKQPICQCPYRVPQLQYEVESMLASGIIEPSNSEWCSPVVIVCKKDDSLRISIDFRKLNAVSEFDAYPMPRVDELLERIGKVKFITTLDLCKGYWQVTLEPSRRQYTAFRTPSGLFQFTVMPFGLHGAPATFQRLMDKVLWGCEDYSAAYLDDVIIYSNSWKEHVLHLTKVLEKIGAGLRFNISKCFWAQEQTGY